jgi:hypothetical protein
VHSAELGCDEANRAVYGAVHDMGMKVTSFTRAAPGRPGRLSAVGSDRSGQVTITCRPEGGVVIDPRQATIGDRTFERGVFLSVAGRSGLQMERGQVVGRVKPVGDLAQAAGSGAPIPSGSVEVQVQPQRGFESVLDFSADLAAAGILPVRITIRNGSRRTYTLALEDVTLRLRGSGDAAARMTAAEASAKLAAKAAGKDSLGDVDAAGQAIRGKELQAAKLAPGASVSGYLFFPVADYERASIRMLDVAAEETESFLVEF